eukprot:gene844-9093_t
MSDIQKIEEQILSNKKNINQLLDLFQICEESKDDKTTLSSLQSIFNVFSVYLKKEQKNTPSVAREEYNEWLNSNLNDFFDLILLNLFKTKSTEKCFTLYFQSITNEIIFSKTKKEDIINHRIEQILEKLTYEIETSVKVMEIFKVNYLIEYQDILYYTLDVLSKLIQKKKCTKLSTLNFCKNLLLIADKIEIPTKFKFLLLENSSIQSSDSTNQKKRKIKNTKHELENSIEYKKVFQNYWISFLQIKDMPLVVYHLVLIKMSQEIIPNFENPFLLNDFIAGSFDKGGDIAVLSMESLFTLITKYNLIYPNFYDKLYSILNVDLFKTSSYSSKFKKLVFKFLNSSHLPQYIVASFIKKLSRLCLFVPPHSIIYILSLIYHLIQKNPDLRNLIHRVEEFSNSDSSGPLNIGKDRLEIWEGNDPFQFEELDLKKTNAGESTLWEIETLKSHWNPQVTEFVKSFKEKIIDSQPGFKVDDYVFLSYDHLFEEEFNSMNENETYFQYEKKKNFLQEFTFLN